MPKYAEEILAAVTELQQHPTAEQVFLEMKREHPSIALGTVYLPPCREQEKTILWRRSIMNANVSLLLNEQINKEFYSAYLYLDFANYYAAVGLDGFENWYRVQAQEERDHAMLFCQYLQNNGEGVTFEAIAKPEWERGDHMAPPASMPSTPPHTRSGTSAPCRCWTGSSRNRVRRRRTPLTSLPRWICSAVTARGCIC